MDASVSGRISGDGHATVKAADRTGQVGPRTDGGVRERPPVGGVHWGDLSVDDDRPPGGDRHTRIQIQAVRNTDVSLGLAAETDATPRRRGRRIASEKVHGDIQAIRTGLPGNADIAALRPDRFCRAGEPHDPGAGGVSREPVDDHVTLRRDGVVDVDRADRPDAGQGDLLRRLERRASDHADAVTGVTKRVAGQRHAIGVTTHRGAQVDAVRTIGLRTRPPIGEADRGALTVEHDRTPGPDGRGRDRIDAVILQGPFDRVAIERDAAAAGRREDRIQGGDRLTKIESAAAAETGAGDRDVADQGRDRGAIQTGAVGGADRSRIPDRPADAVDDDVALRAPDDDVVSTKGIDAGATRGLT